MAEKLFGPVILMCAFFGCVVLLMISLMNVVYANVDTGSATTSSRINDLFRDLEYTLCDPPSFEVTHDYVSSQYVFAEHNDQEFDLPGGSDHPIGVILVRNGTGIWGERDGTNDFWYLWQNYGWFGLETATATIPLESIVTSYDPSTNLSVMYVTMRFTLTVVFHSPDEYLPDALYFNHYYMSMGISLNDTLDSISPWTMLGKIMTFRMPGTNWVTGALIAVPIYTALIYMAFVIIRSCIPLLGG